MTTTALPTLHRFDEVAQTYGLSLRSMTDQARAYRFEHIHIGNARFFTPEQLTAFLKQRTKRPAGKQASASRGGRPRGRKTRTTTQAQAA